MTTLVAFKKKDFIILAADNQETFIDSETQAVSNTTKVNKIVDASFGFMTCAGFAEHFYFFQKLVKSSQIEYLSELGDCIQKTVKMAKDAGTSNFETDIFFTVPYEDDIRVLSSSLNEDGEIFDVCHDDNILLCLPEEMGEYDEYFDSIFNKIKATEKEEECELLVSELMIFISERSDFSSLSHDIAIHYNDGTKVFKKF